MTSSSSRLRRTPRLLEAAALLAATRTVLFASPRRLTAILLRRASAPGAPVLIEAEQGARTIVEDVESVASLLPSTCLSRALAGWIMLRRRGIVANVRIGARLATGMGVDFHAWLELAGTPLSRHEEASRFVTLSR